MGGYTEATLFIRCDCGAEVDMRDRLNAGNFQKSAASGYMFVTVFTHCPNCPKQLGFTIQSAEK